MSIPNEAVLLRVFVGEEDKFRGASLCQAIIDKALEQGLAGATVFGGMEGFGRSRYLRSEINVDARPRQPVVIEIVGGDNAITGLLPFFHDSIESGLVTMERIGACRYPHRAKERLALPKTLPPVAHERPGTANGGSEDAAKIEEGRGLAKEIPMDIPHDAVLLRIFTSGGDHAGLEPLYSAIVKRALAAGLAGATVLKGPVGFGQSAQLHKTHLLGGSRDAQFVVEIVDAKEKIDGFLPVLDELMESGLVTLEAAKVLQYGRQHAPLLQRIKDHFRYHLHSA